MSLETLNFFELDTSEIWIPLDIPGVDASLGYYISSKSKIAKLHAGPNPYENAPYVAFIPLGVVTREEKKFVNIKVGSTLKRVFLDTAFIHCFFGSNFVRYFSNLRRARNAQGYLTLEGMLTLPENPLVNTELHRIYNITAEKHWKGKNVYNGLRIWPEVLGFPGKPLNPIFTKLQKGKIHYCESQTTEYVDAEGVTWRPLIDYEADLSEFSCYWISTTGLVVKFPESLGGPSNSLNIPIRLGVNCVQILPKTPTGSSGVSTIYLKNDLGTLISRSLRVLVYKTFINPDCNGRIGCVFKLTGFNSTNLLYEE